MRKLSATATLAVLTLGGASTASAQLALRGSDTLDLVTNDVIAACGLVGAVNYVGGGSSGGQAAMASNPSTQRVSPMSRELNGSACVAGPSSGQLMIGLDGLSIIGANQTGSVPSTCSDNITGGLTLPVAGCTATDGCSTPGQYTFTDWRDVLAMIYGGQNSATANGALLISGARNPARINCASPVRRALVDNFGSVVTNRSCSGTNCVRLNHVFRRDDISGTTDTFVTLVGMAPIPNYATAFSTGPTANAAANPFCNAGTAVMNKGDSDYLDLDPIRRPCKFKLTNPRANIEDVCEGYALPNNLDASCVAAAPSGPGAPTQIERSAFNGRGMVALTSAQTSKDALTADLKAQGCLGLVLPISIPQNIAVANLYPTKTCTGGGFRALAIPAPGAVCPDGLNPPCALPAVDNGPGVPPSFDCISDSATPAGAGLRDGRIYNTFILNATGQVVRDNFNNPNFADPREARIVRPFFRLHSRHVDTTSPAVATGGPCSATDDTSQIGCLVKASPCSLGFAGREGVDKNAPFRNFGLQLAGVSPTDANINAFAYPMARKLWFNSFVAGGTAFGPTLTTAEQSLYTCFSNPAVIDPIMIARNYLPVPASMNPRLRSCPAGAP